MTNTTSTETPIAPVDRPKKRGLIWVVAFLIVAGVAGYAVYKIGQPGQIIQSAAGGGRAAGGSGGRGARGGRAAGGGGATPVAVQRVRTSSVPVYLTGLGNASAYATVAVKPRVDGQLMSINFKEGDMVKAGDPLAVVDDRPFQVQLQQAEGQYARDSAQLANARTDLERYKGLMAQNAVPKQQMDTQAAVVGQLEGTLKVDQAAINNAKLQLEYSVVKAPISGRIGIRAVDPGNIVRAADAAGLLTITQIQPISVLFTISEENLPQVTSKLHAGAKLTVEAWNSDSTKMLDSGYLVTIDNQIDQSTGTARLKAVMPNEDAELYPNQFVNVKLLVETKRDQIVVPNVAIQTGQQGRFVYVVDENSKVHIRPVEIGIGMANDSSITSGLEVGEQVVVDGADRLIENSTVQIRSANGRAAGGGRGGRGGRGGSGGRGGRQGADAGASAGSDTAAGMQAGGGARAGGRGGSGRGGRGGSGRGGRGRRGGGAAE